MQLIRERPFVIVALAVGIAGMPWASHESVRHAQNTIRGYQIRACEQLGNPRARQITRNGEVLHALLQTAEKARRESAVHESGALARADRRTARTYRALERKIAPAPVARCEVVYPKP